MQLALLDVTWRLDAVDLRLGPRVASDLIGVFAVVGCNVLTEFLTAFVSHQDKEACHLQNILPDEVTTHELPSEQIMMRPLVDGLQ
jgi:hypothetical protein